MGNGYWAMAPMDHESHVDFVALSLSSFDGAAYHLSGPGVRGGGGMQILSSRVLDSGFRLSSFSQSLSFPPAGLIFPVSAHIGLHNLDNTAPVKGRHFVLNLSWPAES